MNCPRCGQPVEQGAAFCGNCGQALAVASPTPAPVPTTPTVPQPGAPQVPPQATQPVVSAAPAAVAPVVPGSAPMPAYAVPHQKGETKAIIGLISGVLSIPGAILPIAGFVLGITAVVTSSMSMQVKRKLAILGLIFGILGILLSIAATVYNLQHRGDASLSSKTQTISTSCYDAKISVDLKADNNSADSCDLRAMNGETIGKSTIVEEISNSLESEVTPSNFVTLAKRVTPSLVEEASSGARKFTLTNEHAGTFAKEAAYFVTMKANDGATAEFVSVLHNAPNGNNLFVFFEARVHGDANLSDLEANFNWK